MSTIWDYYNSADAFVATVLGVTRSIDPDAVCGGVENSWEMAVCGAIGAHGQHRGDEPAPRPEGEGQ